MHTWPRPLPHQPRATSCKPELHFRFHGGRTGQGKNCHPSSNSTNRTPRTHELAPIDPLLLDHNGPVSNWVYTNLPDMQRHDTQAEILDSTSNRLALLCSRQWGKSTIIALKSLHYLLHNPNAHIIILSASENQSNLLLEKIIHFALQLGVETRLRGNELRFPNLALVRALPNNPKTIRGFSAVDVLIIDEAAFATDHLFHAALPFLAIRNGAVWLLSTPNGQSGFFYDIITTSGSAASGSGASGSAAFGSDAFAREAFTDRVALAEGHGTPDRVPLAEGQPPQHHSANPDQRNESAHNASAYKFAIFIATAYDCTWISPDFLASERAQKPSAQFAQEYLCQFLPTRGQIFDAAILNTTSTITQGPLAPTLLFGLDIGFQQSHTALAVLHLSWSHQGQDPVTHAPKYDAHLSLVQLERFPLATAHQEAWATIDRTIQRHTELVIKNGNTPARILIFDYAGAGQVYFEHFKKHCKGTQIQPVTITGGQSPQAKSDYVTIPRQDLLNTLKVLLETSALQIPPGLNYLKELMDELKGINLSNTQRSHDDLAIALSLAAYRARVQMTQPPTAKQQGRLL